MIPCIATHPAAALDRDGGRAWTIEGCPVPMTCPLTYGQIREVIAWLDVEHSARYLPEDGETYCNIYASDLLHILGKYLPRQWWSDPYDTQVYIDNYGHAPEIRYGVNTREMNANMLRDWAKKYGEEFGLLRYNSAEDLKGDLNRFDALGVMIAQSPHGHGHVAVCLPDAIASSTPGKGILMSQAGSTNMEYYRGATVDYKDMFWGLYTKA